MSLPCRFIVAAALLVPFTVATRADEADDYFEGDLNIADIARFHDLPTRFYLRPEFKDRVLEYFLPDEFMELFVRVIRGDYDDELTLQTARCLERVAREQLAEPDTFADDLRERLKKSEDRNVRRSCAMALAAVGQKDDADMLAGLCQPNDEVLCAALEPVLAEWKSEALLDTWQKRVQAPHANSQTLLELACNGLVALNATQSAPGLQRLAASDQIRFSMRKVAAESVAVLAPKDAFQLATDLSAGGLKERIIATLLLDSAATDDSFSLVEKLCDDSADVVASVAWNTLVRQKPERLLSRLDAGKKHRDPNVRSAVVRTAGLLPTLERCGLLSEILGDAHLGVRNEARRVLQSLAEKDEKLQERILANAGEVIETSRSNWQQLEQSMLLLGHLRHDVYQPACVPLLTHERPEVLVTAAWLLHVMPQDPLGEPAAAVAQKHWEIMKRDSVSNPNFKAYDEQLVFLLHVAAYTKRTELKDLCAEQFDKESLLDPDGRAVAMWTLGALSEDSKDDALVGRFVERIFDDDPILPEFTTVRCGSALAIGLVGSANSIPALERAHAVYRVDTTLGRFVSIALRALGEEPPPMPELKPVPIQNWSVAPSSL